MTSRVHWASLECDEASPSTSPKTNEGTVGDRGICETVTQTFCPGPKSVAIHTSGLTDGNGFNRVLESEETTEWVWLWDIRSRCISWNLRGRYRRASAACFLILITDASVCVRRMEPLLVAW